MRGHETTHRVSTRSTCRFGPRRLSVPRPLMPVLPCGFLMTDETHIRHTDISQTSLVTESDIDASWIQYHTCNYLRPLIRICSEKESIKWKRYRCITSLDLKKNLLLSWHKHPQGPQIYSHTSLLWTKHSVWSSLGKNIPIYMVFTVFRGEINWHVWAEADLKKKKKKRWDEMKTWKIWTH